MSRQSLMILAAAAALTTHTPMPDTQPPPRTLLKRGKFPDLVDRPGPDARPLDWRRFQAQYRLRSKYGTLVHPTSGRGRRGTHYRPQVRRHVFLDAAGQPVAFPTWQGEFDLPEDPEEIEAAFARHGVTGVRRLTKAEKKARKRAKGYDPVTVTPVYPS